LGLSVFSATSKEISRIPLIDNQGKRHYNYTVNAIAVLNGSEILLAAEHVGLCVYNTKSNAVNILTDRLPIANTVRIDHRNGKAWIGARSGLFIYDLQSRVIQKYTLGNKASDDSWITDLLIDKTGCIWATTDGQGIIKIKGNDFNSYTVIKQENSGSLSSNAVYTIFEDELSKIWIGTLRGGIDMIDAKKKQFKAYAHDSYTKNSLVNNFTFSFCEDKDKSVWVGTDGGGLSIWDRASNSFRNNPYKISDGAQTSNFHVASIIKDAQQRIWFAAFANGIYRFNPNNKQFERILMESNHTLNAVWKLYYGQNQDVWATCLPGLSTSDQNNRIFKYDNNLNRFKAAPFPVSADIISLIDDDKDNLWMGSFTGLVHANKKSGIDKVFDLKTAVRALHKSRSGKLWIGTYGRGLMSFDKSSDKFVSYTEEDGLSNNKVLNIEEDNSGNIWVSTYNGLSKLVPATGHIENFYVADGLQSNQFYYNASAKLSDGQILFGGIKGFNIFNPDSIKQFYDFPRLLITGLRVDNTPVNATSGFIKDDESVFKTEQIELPYDKAILSIDYAALEYSKPDKIQYAYMLLGRDKKWNFVNNIRSINYSRLNEGDYVLKIKSTNASGIWNTKEKIINIKVLPPWYRTWWAYCTYLGLISLSIYGYLFYQRKQTRLAYEVKLTKELNEKKISFFTNISHELRTPLTLIVNPIKDLLQSNGANIDLIDISSVYRNSRRLLSLVDQLLLFRTSENEIADLQQKWLNLKDVCFEVFLCFNNQVKAKGLDYQFQCADQELKVFADREKLEIVLFNLLSNAIKYTPDNGSVSLEISKNDCFVTVLVKDTGKGIPEDTGEKLFEKFYRLPVENQTTEQGGFGIGLFLAKKYMEIQQGNLTYSSVLGKGTIFQLQLPVFTDNRSEGEQGIVNNCSFPLLQELIADTSEIENQAVNLVDNRHVDEILGNFVNEKAVILLIDDDREIRTYIKQLLLDSYTVYEADNTDAGFEIVLENEPDIIVCDVIMKGTSGVEFCSKMKESPSFSHIPIILLTGTSSPEIKLKGIECGADDYITKPFESELLVARIKSLLKGRDTLKDYFFNEITLKNNSLKIPAEYSDFLTTCIKIVESHLDDDGFSIKVLAEEIGMSRSKLFRKIKSISGLSNTEFIRYIRLRKAAELMIQTDLQIKEIAFQIGFQDIRYFREQFHKLFDMNPSDFVRKYRKTFNKSWSLNNSFANQKNKQ
ncbi:MAG: hybrid sensor histidine kinase/response regulator, partial [Mucilaginibacter sp.]|nr:hybrid sensor histidine kinase/response regulator [Mucilaginibacter sp.]